MTVTVLQDLRFALRLLRRSPAFTAVAVLILALAIGGTSSVFGVVDALLFQGLSYAPVDELVTVWQDHRALGMTLLAAAGFVMLITCITVGSLLVARAINRQREMMVRSALGASRGRVIRQLLTESSVIAVLGGIGGILVALWGIEFLVALLPPDVSRLNPIGLDTRVLSFTAMLTFGTGLLLGLLPAAYVSSASFGNVVRAE
jgi:ABC-type antimicrobial peptide transport system permease subunit